jgi:hypothetical protein
MVAQPSRPSGKKDLSVLIWLAVMGWFIRYLSYLGLLGSAVVLGELLLAIKLERGSISISIGDVLEFVLTVWLALLTVTPSSLRFARRDLPENRSRSRFVLRQL